MPDYYDGARARMLQRCHHSDSFSPQSSNARWTSQPCSRRSSSSRTGRRRRSQRTSTSFGPTACSTTVIRCVMGKAEAAGRADTTFSQSHPLRHSAEVLRAKSNQLLEFITDPTLSQRSLLAAHMSSAALDARRAGSTRVGTPDEDADADAESDDEPARHKRALSERFLNGINGDSEFSQADQGEPGLTFPPQLLTTRLPRLHHRALPHLASLDV